MDVGLLAAAFSAMLGAKVVPPGQDTAGLKTVSVHNLFRTTHHIMRPGSVAQAAVVGHGEEFEISMMTLTGTKYPVNVTKDHTIAHVKAAVKSAHGIPIAGQRLIFNSKILGDHETIESLGIPPGGICCLIELGGEDATEEFVMDDSELAPRFDYDFTNERDDGKRYLRGGFEYHRPYGWMRFALNVLNRKEYNRDNTWLGADGIRTESTTGEWPVSYHGTKQQNVKYIIDTGYKIGYRQLHGPGVYSSPDLPMVSRLYSQDFEYHGKRYLVALQNRVNPAKVKTQRESQPPSPDPYGDCTFVIVSEKLTGVGADYWRCPRQNPDQGIYDIRPYGILIREI